MLNMLFKKKFRSFALIASLSLCLLNAHGTSVAAHHLMGYGLVVTATLPACTKTSYSLSFFNFSLHDTAQHRPLAIGLLAFKNIRQFKSQTLTSPTQPTQPTSIVGEVIISLLSLLGLASLVRVKDWSMQLSPEVDLTVFGLCLLALIAVGLYYLIRFYLRDVASKPENSIFGSQGKARSVQFNNLKAGQGTSIDPIRYMQYKPVNVGNDASARPWEQIGADSGSLDKNIEFEDRLGQFSHTSRSNHWSIPEGFDAVSFVQTAKNVFMTLQDAWDRADMGILHSMLTDQMLSEIRTQLSEREQHTQGAPNKTEVIMLSADLLGVQEVEQGYLASIEFSGLINENPSQGPNPFREVWSMCRPKNNSTGWLVSGVQALQ